MTDLIKREDVLREVAKHRNQAGNAFVCDALFALYNAIAALPAEPAPSTDTMSNPRGGYSTERPGL